MALINITLILALGGLRCCTPGTHDLVRVRVRVRVRVSDSARVSVWLKVKGQGLHWRS